MPEWPGDGNCAPRNRLLSLFRLLRMAPTGLASGGRERVRTCPGRCSSRLLAEAAEGALLLAAKFLGVTQEPWLQRCPAIVDPVSAKRGTGGGIPLMNFSECAYQLLTS